MGEARLANGTIRAGVFEHRAQIPYQIEEVDGAEHLIATFGGFVIDGSGSQPPQALRRRLRDLRAHRLYLGSDEHFLLGPRNEFAGARTLTCLIRSEAQRLGIPLTHVIAVGGSFSGTTALMVGLHVPVGRLFVGACPVRMGRWGNRLVERHAGMPELPVNRFRLAEKLRLDEPDEVRRLDELMVREAEWVTEPMEVTLIASPADRLAAELEFFHDAIAGHPTIHCELERPDYDRHRDLGPILYHRMLQLLLPVVGSTSVPASAGDG